MGQTDKDNYMVSKGAAFNNEPQLFFSRSLEAGAFHKGQHVPKSLCRKIILWLDTF